MKVILLLLFSNEKDYVHINYFSNIYFLIYSLIILFLYLLLNFYIVPLLIVYLLHLCTFKTPILRQIIF